MDISRGQHVDLKISQSRIKVIDDQKQIVETPTKIPMKRSFDVAFLMLPDEKLKNKEVPQENNSLDVDVTSYPLSELSVRSDLINRYHHMNRVINNNKIFINSEYSNVFKSNEDRYSSGSLNSTASSDKSDDMIESEIPRSAFSKVTQINNIESPLPPPLSPESCSSASPPISYSPPSTNFRADYSHFINSSAFQAINQPGFTPHGKYKQLIYRGNSIATSNHNVSNNDGHLQAFQFGTANSHAAAFMAQPEQFIRNPAAAILSSLLPTTLGALSLPAQNVCAKCNISFRMTSDLVYHMRSHHKNENVQDPNRRKREEKLKCPVCSESFRERHHLTRHMTAHQDKEGDLLDHEIAEYQAHRK